MDFGSGPGPTLSAMFEDVGHSMTLYDPFYASDQSALDKRYDFITATEVVEHLHEPGRELERLWACLKPGGLLAVMTSLADDCEAFAKWHYIQDPTHVCFFHQETFKWWAAERQAGLTFADNDVMLFYKPESRMA